MSESVRKQREDRIAVRAVEVCKSFGEKTVLEGVSFELSAGEGLCICGVNAAGKTTLIKLMSTMMRANKGVIEICGFDSQRDREQIKPLIGVIFHQSLLYPELTVIENLSFFAKLYGVEDRKSRIEEVLEQLRLRAYGCERVSVLSQGMVRRFSIARALICNPLVLLADEPFAGLDSDASEELVEILQRFKEGRRVLVLTTHSVDFGLRCCERAAVLDGGKFIFERSLSEIDAGKFSRDYLSYARGCN